jgi:hypothetical protein
MPLRAATEAVRPVAFAVTGFAAVIVGGVGAEVMVAVALPGALVDPAALISTQLRLSVGGAPAVKVMLFVVPLVTPDAPPALVIVPPATVH